MLLTLSQPGTTEFGMRPPHEYSPTLHSRPHYHHHSPKSSFDRRDTSLPASNQFAMSTSHRGLPPPSAMNLPDPIRQPPPQPPPPMPSQQPLGPMPAPPNQWQGAEDSMRNWLSTKAEEERRKQEEARIRQEELKLEQRRVEQAMLRESMQGGVPPQMIPMIFAGIGGSALAHVSVEWLQQYAAQQMQALDVSAESRREPRMINPPQPPYAPAVGAQVQPPLPLSVHQTTFPAFPQDGRNAAPAPTSAPRSAMSGLSRLNTVDLPQQQQQQQQAAGTGSAHPTRQTEQNSSPSIYFHHWVPPQQHESNKSNQPPTPSGRNDPGSAHPSHVEGDYKESPRKRKATGAHQPTPAPSQTSPSFSHQKDTRRHMQGSHSRSRSQKSNEGHPGDRVPMGRKDSVAAPRTSHESYRDESGRPYAQSGPTEVR